MTGVVFLLFLIFNHLFHNSIKDCLKFYLKKLIKFENGILTFVATYVLSFLILYIGIGIFLMIFYFGFDFQFLFEPRYYFKLLSDF